MEVYTEIHTVPICGSPVAVPQPIELYRREVAMDRTQDRHS